MNILFIGDIVGDIGTTFIENNLYSIKKNYNIDFVIANGENSAIGNGILPQSANRLFTSGVDIITGGNHSFNRWEIKEYIKNHPNLIRPYNYPNNRYGKGYAIYNFKYQNKIVKIGVINMMGTVYLDSLNNPFLSADEVVNYLSDKTDIIIFDFHAEATAEKIALGFYLDGRVTAVLGTHTHIPTADEHLLPKGTAYITDAGMVGPSYSVLGVNVDKIITKFTTKMPVRFTPGSGSTLFSSVIISIDDHTFKATDIKRLQIEK